MISELMALVFGLLTALLDSSNGSVIDGRECDRPDGDVVTLEEVVGAVRHYLCVSEIDNGHANGFGCGGGDSHDGLLVLERCKVRCKDGGTTIWRLRCSAEVSQSFASRAISVQEAKTITLFNHA